MAVRLRDESKHGDERPGEDARLFSGQCGDRVPPCDKPRFRAAGPVQEFVETSGKCPHACGRLYRVTKRHLFEREDHAVPRSLFDPDRTRRDLAVFALRKQAAEFSLMQNLFPPLMGLAFVIPFPGKIGLIAKSFRKKTQKFPATGRGSA